MSDVTPLLKTLIKYISYPPSIQCYALCCGWFSWRENNGQKDKNSSKKKKKKKRISCELFHRSHKVKS